MINDGSQSNAISIHAPARGATLCCMSGGLRGQISIHAPARGATVSALEQSVFPEDFNPRSRKGSDDELSPAG